MLEFFISGVNVYLFVCVPYFNLLKTAVMLCYVH